MPVLCRDCLTVFERGARCPGCRSPRVVAHPELFELSIAHMDCDAFYASVEKRDNPELRDRPLIVGGGRRGVVSTCCYLARIKGVHSAMPMFRALKLCPDAVVLPPRFPAYAEASRAIRAMMEELTPSVEPLSLDEAFMDLSGTMRLHGAPPAVMLARLAQRMKEELGLTGSIGLSHNKFLAKIASDLDKPRGFSVIGRAETRDFLRPRPVRTIWGIGPAAQEALDRVGVHTIADLERWEKSELVRRFGAMGERLWHLARGEDARRVTPDEPVHSISSETTFDEDTGDPALLDGHLWRMADKTASRAKAQGLAGGVVTLKLRRADFRILTRRVTLPHPTQTADRTYQTARSLLDQTRDPGPFRLLGVGLSGIVPERGDDPQRDLLDPAATRREGAERAADRVRARFGEEAIFKGRGWR